MMYGDYCVEFLFENTNLELEMEMKGITCIKNNNTADIRCKLIARLGKCFERLLLVRL